MAKKTNEEMMADVARSIKPYRDTTTTFRRLPEAGRDKEEISRVAVTLTDMAEWVEPRLRICELEDDPDNRVLECAVFGKADRIVTGDKEMLRLRGYQDTKIISLRAYLSSQ